MFAKFETTRNSLLVLFKDYCTVLHTFCRKFNLFTVNNFDSVLQLSIAKLCSFYSCLVKRIRFIRFKIQRSCFRSELFVRKVVLFCSTYKLGFALTLHP